MAKQLSDTIITGTYGNLVFYEMEGTGYVRRKSSLSRRQFKTKACFANSRNSAARFKMANRIAGEVYRSLPADIRQYNLFCVLKTAAIRLLKDGTPEQVVKTYLEALSNASAVA